MTSKRNSINPGDLLLVYLDAKRQFLVQVAKGLQVQSDHGNITLDSIIGKPYGYIGETHLGHAFYCLRPSIADLMFKIKRKTTIVYPKDLGYLLLETTVGPGAQVLEIGTGSGALTLVLAKLVAPDGVVYSYDRREEFITLAKQNLERAGYDQNVRFFVREIDQQGFDDHEVDAIFIDVPEPWNIVPHAKCVLKGGHHLVCWSPNIEQVKRVVEALHTHDFIRTRISEITEREMLVRERGVRPRERGITHTAYLIKAQRILKRM